MAFYMDSRTPNAAARKGSIQPGRETPDHDGTYGERGELGPPTRVREARALSDNRVTFSPRGASLANLNGPPGSFSSTLKTINVPRYTSFTSDNGTYANPDDGQYGDGKSSEQRQAEFKEKINKELKIKVGSENLLEALLAKNSRQTKEQRQKVEDQLSLSNDKIASLRLQLKEEIERSERSKRPVTPNKIQQPSFYRGSPLRSPAQIEEDGNLNNSEHDLDTESPTYVLADILQDLEVESMQPDYYVGRANTLVELFKRYPTLKYDLAWRIFGLRMQIMLLSESREVVAAGYRVIRHSIADRNSLQTIRGLHTDALVILSLVKDSKATIEREQALKFVRAFLDVKGGVKELSVAVVRMVVSVAEHFEDRLRNMALLTLTEILVKDPSLLAAAGGMASLADVLGEGSYAGSDSVVSAFLRIIDSPLLRTLLASGRELEGAFAAFTDPVATHGREERLKVNARSIASILNSWPGIFMVAKDGFSTLRSLLLSLAHPTSIARDLVLDLLFDVLHIKPPSWTSSFLAGRRLTTYGRVTNLRADPLENRSRIDSEDDLERASLVDHYKTLVLAALVHCGLLKALSDVIALAIDISQKRKATLLLGEVLKLANYVLPSSISLALQVFPSLMGSAVQDDSKDHLISTSMIYQIDSLNRTLYRSGISKGPTNSFSEATSIPKPTDTGKAKIDMDELQLRNLINESQVNATLTYVKWKWDIILEIIEGPMLNPKRLEDTLKSTKFLKRLEGFYRPFKYRFANAKNTKPNQRYVRIGCAFLKSLMQTQEGVVYLSESKLLRQLAECLAQLDPSSGLTSPDPLFAPHRVSETLTAGYFTLLGTLSGDPQGLTMIGRWRMINIFYHIIDLKNRDDLVQLLLGNMELSLDSHLRVMLSKALTSCSKTTRIFSTKLLRKYATRDSSNNAPQRNPSNTAYWAIRLLVTQLYDPEVEVSEVAVQILQEACNRKQYLEYVVRCRPALDHLGEIGAPLLLRFLSTSLGYQYLDGLDYITQEMDDWFLGRNEKYVTLVEASLSKALSHESHRPQSIVDEAMPHQEYGVVPPHFYRELTRTSEGCGLLRASGHFENFTSTIQAHWSEKQDYEVMLKVKGCLWAVGNIGSMDLGTPFLEESNIITWIVKIAEQSEVISLRGTSFFVLGLISRSLHGMEILAEHGWDAATDSMGQSLGYCLPASLKKLLTIPGLKPTEDILHRRLTAQKIEATSEDTDPIQSRVLSLVVDLGNTVLTNRAAAELRGIKAKHPGTFSSVSLFKRIMVILQSHTYRLLVRRFVMEMFDKGVMRQIVLDENSDDEDDEEPQATARPNLAL
ncbi:MAG: hypothetical protein MMC33_000844 [Icmadophila ericetorum]|nr:hypothetical protein [Icmadophila ericetorum]